MRQLALAEIMLAEQANRCQFNILIAFPRNMDPSPGERTVR